MRIASLDDSWLYKPALAAVAVTTHHNLGVLSFLCEVDVRFSLVKRSLVDNGVDEVAWIHHVTHLNLGCHSLHVVENASPQALGDVHARCCRALLALELIGSAEGSSGNSLRIGTGVNKDEVLTTSLTHEAWIRDVLVNIHASLFPQRLEGCSATGEVDS